MSSLIDRLAVIDVLEERLQANGYSNATLVSELNRSIRYLMLLPTVEAIPIDWIKKYVEDNTQLMINPEYENTEFTKEPIDYYIKLYPYQINTMLKAWEKENENSK